MKDFNISNGVGGVQICLINIFLLWNKLSKIL